MMVEYDINPSMDNKYRFATMFMDSVPETERLKIRKICRKYGVGVVMCRMDKTPGKVDEYTWFHVVLYIAEDVYYTEDGELDYRNDFNSEKYYSLMNCINELDIRTCLAFNTKGDTSVYSDPDLVQYDSFANVINNPVIFDDENCPCDKDH